MKKLLQLISAAVVTLTVGFVPAVSAATCTINTTGPGSNNNCTVNNAHTVTVTCTNGVNVNNVNSQSAASGSVNVSGNTISGTATSGDAANVNQVATELSQACAAAPTTPPATGGQGGGTSTPASPAVAGVQSTKVAALPNTGPSTLVTSIALAAVAVGSVAGLAHIALSIRRRAFKA